MIRVPLLSGAYQSRSIIAGSQRCINLYPENNDDKQAPVPVTHFPTPGLRLRATPPAIGSSRCLYRASNGNQYQVIDNTVYQISSGFVYTALGTVAALLDQVIMADNGIVVVLVDGTNTGYVIEMASGNFAPISDPNFLGGTYVRYLDGFFVFNTPGTNEWQISLYLVDFGNLTAGVIVPPALYAAFDPLDVATKNGYPDPIVGVVVMHRNLWLLGALTTEVWYNAGAADFPFQAIPGVFSQFGCAAPYSIASQDLSLFWLAQDMNGKALVLRGAADYSVSEISSKGIEAILQQAPIIDDAIGNCYQQNGHAYYVLTFPSLGRTFQVELKTQQWTEIAYTGQNGFERYRGINWAFNFNINLVADYQNGKLYELDPNLYTDFDTPISRLRTIPHILNEGDRFRLNRVIADVQGGTLTSATPQNPPPMFLRVSRDRGGSYGNIVESQFGAAGEYAHLPYWANLGIGRDFVLELSWSAPINTALNGLWIDATPMVT